MCEHWNHVLVRLNSISINIASGIEEKYFCIKVVHFIPLVQDVSHQFRRWSINDCGRDNIGHVSRITVLWDLQLLVGVELAYSC
jgi:hypothetical protein